jgi:translation elongation factor EF-1alpha
LSYSEKFSSNVREKITKPFRMSVEACYESNVQSKKGYILSGRIEGGVLKRNEKLILKPINLDVNIKDIHIGDQSTPIAYPGDICDVMITLKKEKDWALIHKGCFLSSIKFHVPTARTFIADIKLYDIKDPILRGSRVNLHLCGFVEGGLISKLKHTFNPTTHEVLKKNPRFLLANESAQVEISVDKEICVEIYSNFSSLGRFQFREKGRTLGEGRVVTILK